MPSEARAPKGACPPARRRDRRRSPTRATRRRREKQGRPKGAGFTPMGDGGRECTAAEQMKKRPHNNETGPCQRATREPRADAGAPKARRGPKEARESGAERTGDGWPSERQQEPSEGRRAGPARRRSRGNAVAPSPRRPRRRETKRRARQASPAEPRRTDGARAERRGLDRHRIAIGSPSHRGRIAVDPSCA